MVQAPCRVVWRCAALPLSRRLGASRRLPASSSRPPAGVLASSSGGGSSAPQHAVRPRRWCGRACRDSVLGERWLVGVSGGIRRASMRRWGVGGWRWSCCGRRRAALGSPGRADAPDEGSEGRRSSTTPLQTPPDSLLFIGRSVGWGAPPFSSVRARVAGFYTGRPMFMHSMWTTLWTTRERVSLPRRGRAQRGGPHPVGELGSQVLRSAELWGGDLAHGRSGSRIGLGPHPHRTG